MIRHCAICLVGYLLISKLNLWYNVSAAQNDVEAF